jgi:hypothetical protein
VPLAEAVIATRVAFRLVRLAPPPHPPPHPPTPQQNPSPLPHPSFQTPAEMLLAEAVIATRVAFRLMRLVSISRAFRQQRQAAGHKLDLSMDPGEALPPDAFADFAGDGYLEAEGARCDWEGAGGALSAPGGLSAADAAGYHNHAYTIEYAAGVVAGSPPATGAHGHGIGAV